MPLQSIRVLDLTRLLPGPYCTMILADFGAEVIKIEEPNIGDYGRNWEPKVYGDGAFFHSLNRNKKSVALNLKESDGKEQFLKLVEKADVVIESFRPGVMERLGLDYETLKKVNPGIVYCAVTGYGQTGPYASMPGHDINYISYAGLLHFMGGRGGKPTVPAAQIADLGGGAFPATVGILLALLEKQKSGKGQFVDISMMDGVISWLQTLLPNYFASGQMENRGELMLSGGKACYEVYETKDGKFISVGALEEKFWREFCKVIEKEEFIPLLNAPRTEQYRLMYEIQQIISTKTQDEWMQLFCQVEACVSPVLSLEELSEDPQVQAREMIIETKHPQGGKLKHIGIPIKLSKTPGSIRTVAPRLGEHSDQTLGDVFNR